MSIKALFFLLKTHFYSFINLPINTNALGIKHKFSVHQRRNFVIGNMYIGTEIRGTYLRITLLNELLSHGKIVNVGIQPHQIFL